VVAVGLMVLRALEAAEILAKQGISAEVIDRGRLFPLDKKTILESIARRAAWRSRTSYSNCGFSAEVAAMAAEEALDELDAPVRRICGLARAARVQSIAG